MLTKISDFLKESKSENMISDLMFNSTDIDGFIEALKLKYGNFVPLYHATTIENSKIIDKEGLKLTQGKNYKSFANEDILYFQIGKSDYIDDRRCVLYKWDAPIEFIEKYAYADMDNINIDEEILQKYVDDINNISSDMKDFMLYYVWNGMEIDGMELLIANRNENDNFPTIIPTKIN